MPFRKSVSEGPLRRFNKIVQLLDVEAIITTDSLPYLTLRWVAPGKESTKEWLSDLDFMQLRVQPQNPVYQLFKPTASATESQGFCICRPSASISVLAGKVRAATGCKISGSTKGRHHCVQWITYCFVACQETRHFEGASSFLVQCFVQCNCSLAGVRNGVEKKVFAWEGTWK